MYEEGEGWKGGKGHLACAIKFLARVQTLSGVKKVFPNNLYQT